MVACFRFAFAQSKATQHPRMQVTKMLDKTLAVVEEVVAEVAAEVIVPLPQDASSLQDEGYTALQPESHGEFNATQEEGAHQIVSGEEAQLTQSAMARAVSSSERKPCMEQINPSHETLTDHSHTTGTLAQ